MLIKNTHAIMNKYASNFTRSMAICGGGVRSVYKFKSDVPYVANMPIVAYTSNNNGNVDQEQNRVYDYSALLTAETEDDFNKVVNNVTYKRLRDITSEEYERLVNNAAVAAAKMYNVQETTSLLKSIDEI